MRPCDRSRCSRLLPDARGGGGPEFPFWQLKRVEWFFRGRDFHGSLPDALYTYRLIQVTHWSAREIEEAPQQLCDWILAIDNARRKAEASRSGGAPTDQQIEEELRA